jgi:hypothetical protein
MFLFFFVFYYYRFTLGSLSLQSDTRRMSLRETSKKTRRRNDVRKGLRAAGEASQNVAVVERAVVVEGRPRKE